MFLYAFNAYTCLFFMFFEIFKIFKFFDDFRQSFSFLMLTGTFVKLK